MRTLGLFELEIKPGDEIMPARVSVVLQKEVRNDSGRLLLTPECISAEELEGLLNLIQDELDEIRVRAQRVYGRT